MRSSSCGQTEAVDNKTNRRAVSPGVRKGVMFLTVVLTCATSLVGVPASANVNYETVTFINTDGHSWVNYVTTRSNASSYTVFLDKNDLLDDYLYINPNDYRFDTSFPDANRLQFQQGNYAFISQGDYIDVENPANSLVTIDGDGLHTLRTWDGNKLDNGHYGFWNTPTDFASFAAAWVLPGEYEIVGYYSNRPGEWVIRGNTLAFFAREVNDLTFEIRYRAVVPQASVALKKELDTTLETTLETAFEKEVNDLEAVSIEQDEDRVTVIFENRILFGSGSAALSPGGLTVISDIADNLAGDDTQIIVEGHTDDITITGDLAERFPTNWELSAKRAINVVHALSSAGIDPTRLQVRAYGPFKPRVPNSSAENRRTNRRIELIIQPSAAP